MSVSELQARAGLAGLGDLEDVLTRLAEGGRIGSEAHRSRSARYVNAVELAPGGLATHLAVAGRSAAGRQVIEYLAAMGRPATVAEVTAAVECTPAVLRRLVGKGVLRQFTQVERLSLGRHILGGLGGQPAKDPEIVLRPDQAHALGRITEIVDRR